MLHKPASHLLSYLKWGLIEAQSRWGFPLAGSAGVERQGRALNVMPTWETAFLPGLPLITGSLIEENGWAWRVLSPSSSILKHRSVRLYESSLSLYKCTLRSDKNYGIQPSILICRCEWAGSIPATQWKNTVTVGGFLKEKTNIHLQVLHVY